MKKHVIWMLAVATVLLGSLSSTVEAGPERDRLRIVANEKKAIYQSKKAISETADFLKQRLGSQTAVEYDRYTAIPDSEATRKQNQYNVWLRVSAQYETAKRQSQSARSAMTRARMEWLAAERAWHICPAGQ